MCDNVLIEVVVNTVGPKNIFVSSMLVLASPSVVFTYKWEKKYEQMLKDGTK